MKLSSIILLIIIIGAIFIVVKNDFDLSNRNDQKKFVSSFLTWLTKVGKNSVDVVGHVIKDYDWKPVADKAIEQNGTNNATNSTRLIFLN